MLDWPEKHRIEREKGLGWGEVEGLGYCKIQTDPHTCWCNLLMHIETERRGAECEFTVKNHWLTSIKHHWLASMVKLGSFLHFVSLVQRKPCVKRIHGEDLWVPDGTVWNFTALQRSPVAATVLTCAPFRKLSNGKAIFFKLVVQSSCFPLVFLFWYDAWTLCFQFHSKMTTVDVSYIKAFT